MEDKFAKKEVCEYCGEQMKSVYRNKMFCSDKCRVYFGREKKNSVVDLAGETNFGQVPTILSEPQKKVTDRVHQVSISNDVPKSQVILLKEPNAKNVFTETIEDKINRLEGEKALLGKGQYADKARKILDARINKLRYG